MTLLLSEGQSRYYLPLSPVQSIGPLRHGGFSTLCHFRPREGMVFFSPDRTFSNFSSRIGHPILSPITEGVYEVFRLRSFKFTQSTPGYRPITGLVYTSDEETSEEWWVTKRKNDWSTTRTLFYLIDLDHYGCIC